MTEKHDDKAERRQRRLEAIKLQEIEGNPLTPEEIAMFEMFDREGFTDEQRHAYILDRINSRKPISPAAE